MVGQFLWVPVAVKCEKDSYKVRYEVEGLGGTHSLCGRKSRPAIGAQPLEYSCWGTAIGAQPLGHSYWGTASGAQPLGHSHWGTAAGAQPLGHSVPLGAQPGRFLTVARQRSCIFGIYPALSLSLFYLILFN